MRRGDTDPKKVFYRSDSRTFRMNGQWFFASREGDQGPYFSEGEAELELKRHIEASQVLSPLKTKAVADDPLEIPDIAEAPVVEVPFGQPKDQDLAGDPYLDDIFEMDNSSLRSYRERHI